jgi:hypothetical protein
MILKIVISAGLMGLALLPSYIWDIPSFNIFNLLYKFAFVVIAFFVLLQGYYKQVFDMAIKAVRSKLGRKKQN